MQALRRMRDPLGLSCIGLAILGIGVLALSSCQSPHNPTRRTEPSLEPGWPRGDNFFQEASYGQLKVPMPAVPDAQKVGDDQLCETCHETYYQSFAHNVHRGVGCEDCHGAASRHLQTRGEPGTILQPAKLPPAEASEICLQCHEENACAPGAQWRCSVHAHCGLSCMDCHRAHYNVPPGTPATQTPDQSSSSGSSSQGLGLPLLPDRPTAGMAAPRHEIRLTAYQDSAQSQAPQPSLKGSSYNLGAVAPGICYRCHEDKRDLEQVAGPHQICGPNGFNCTTCHDPHGKIRESSRVDLCLQCHGNGAPTMAWHSSIHAMEGVACTDCHNPHPSACVPRVVDIRHTNIRRADRLAMSVQEPEVCYKCHQQIYGRTSMPSHHPIKEGKMVCSDCHDAHGQYEKNLKQVTVNLVCYKCHADKQGPFVYEHPPVTENCAYCHEPHGTVANNLMRQPTTFLCLRCHSGHRGGPSFHDNSYLPDFAATSGPGTTTPQERHQLQASFYTNCTQCHSQIHGSDLPTPHRPGAMFR